MKQLRYIALILSLVCLLSIGGCKRQSDPTIESSNVSSFTADLSESSQEFLSSVVEEPVSSKLSVDSESEQETSSHLEPEVSSQPEPSSITETPSSQVESSEPELPTIPFTLHEINLSAINILEDVPTKGEVVLSTFKIKPTDQYERSKDEFKATLIRNCEELAQAGFSIEKSGKELSSDPLQQENSYFEESALILIQTYHTSMSENEKFNSITRLNDQLIINWSLMPYDDPPLKEGEFYVLEDASEYMNYWLEIKQSDVKGITEVISQRSGQAE